MLLLVDSTGRKLSGRGEWLLEKHGTATRRSWRVLHLNVDAGTSGIVKLSLAYPASLRRLPGKSSDPGLLCPCSGQQGFAQQGAFGARPWSRRRSTRFPPHAVPW